MSMHRTLIATAVAGAARLLEAGYGLDIKRRESRLRSAVVEALAGRSEIADLRWSPEWRPELPLWPWKGSKKLGGFDLAIRLTDEKAYSVAVELKWTHYGYINALDDVPWDAFKLAHATSTLEGTSLGVLLYIAPTKAWAKPARFSEFFGDGLVSTASLLSIHRGIWEWSLREGSAAWPLRLPPYLQTSFVAAAPVKVADEQWEIRAASVIANGQPWLDLDERGLPIAGETPPIIDWPVPDAGPGMEPDRAEDIFAWPAVDPKAIPNEGLRSTDLPRPNATWAEICWFAASFDGYRMIGQGEVAELANSSADHYRRTGALKRELGLTELRGCLFFEYRRHNHFGHAPDHKTTPYIRSLIEAIRASIEV